MTEILEENSDESDDLSLNEGRTNEARSVSNVSTNFDHTPHDLFIQLNELSDRPDELREWRETARWIKYEENVEEGADRWGQPHVSSLSFHSLLDLRRCLDTGVVILDSEEKDLAGIVFRAVETVN